MDYYIRGSVSGFTVERAELEAAANFPAVYRHVGNDKWHVSFLQTTPVQPGQRPFLLTIGERLRLETPFVATYRNYRGEVAERRLQPIRVDFGSTDRHPHPQWLLIAYDLDKKAERTFALKDFNPLTFPHDYEAIGNRLLEIGAMCDDQEIARTAYDAATALASPVPAVTAPTVAVEALQDIAAHPADDIRGIASKTLSTLSAQVQDTPGDGRPCTMDEFVAALFEDTSNPFEREDAINEWLYGNWAGATVYLKPETLARIMSKSKPEKYRNPDIFHDADGRN